MTIRKSGENIAVSILPDNRGVKDKAVENIVPLVMSGTPAEFEEGFVDALKPLQEAQGLVSNIKEFEENTEKAKRESEMAKKLKDEAAKQKKEFNDLIALAKQNLSEDKFLDAKKCLAKAAEVKGVDKTLVNRLKDEIAQKSGEGMMFASPIDKSDGKNLVPGKSPVSDSKKEACGDETKGAFAQAAELPEDDTENQE